MLWMRLKKLVGLICLQFINSTFLKLNDMREKSKRQKRVVTEEQQNKIIELHKQLPLKEIAEQLKMRYDWAYQWAKNQGLVLKYCRKVEPSRRMNVEVKGHIFNWDHYHNGETMVLGFHDKKEELKDLFEIKDAKFHKLFPHWQSEGEKLYFRRPQ